MNPQDFRKEIESHSSALTNQRIYNIKEVVWQKSIEVMSNRPNPITTLEYFSSLVTFFIETPGIYNEDDEEKIHQHLQTGNEIASRMRVYGTPTPDDRENLLQISLSLQYMMNIAMQKMRYFFRIGRQDPKGIDAAMKIFEQDVWKKKDVKTRGVHEATGNEPEVPI